MDQTKFDITIQSVWPYEEGKQLTAGVRYKTVYPVRNKLTEIIYRAEAAAKMTYLLHIKDNYDIECAFLEMGTTKIMAASTNKHAKKLAWVHCDLLQAMGNIQAFEEKTARWYRKFDKVICVSESVKDSFDKIFHGEFASEVLYNVVEDDVIREKAQEPVLDIEKRRLTLLAVGTMYPPKNYPRLLQTHQRLLQEGIGHDLWILGDGEQRPQIEQYIQENGLQESVKLFGFQNNPYPYMKTADIIVCSSNYEGFSTVITESVILGKAIVTTDCSGMKEILGDGEYGLITGNSDEKFYEGVKRMLTDPKMREDYTMKAVVRGNAFSLQNQVSKIQDCFIKVYSE